MSIASFAQFDTDLAIARLFPADFVGSYLDIGASHPTVMSNSYLFYLRGWRGLAVDPCRKIDMFAIHRPRDMAFPYAVGDRDGFIPFHELSEDTWSTVSPEEARLRGVTFVTRDVPIRRVDSLLKEAGWDRQFDFVSIDVEGHERAVLDGCDFGGNFRPTVIVIEATRPCTTIPCHDEWEGVLTDAGYRHVGSAGVNRLYSLKG